MHNMMVLPKRNSILFGFNRFPLYDVWACFDNGVMMENLVWVLMPTGPYLHVRVGFPFPHYIGFFYRRLGAVYISTDRDILFDAAEKDQYLVIDSNTVIMVR